MADLGSSKEQILSLYDLYSNDIYRYTYSILGNSSEAYDAVQEVFLRAHRKLPDFRRDSSPKTWLMAIARNYAIDVLRKKQRDNRHVVGQHLPDLIDESVSMDTVLEVKEALDRLNRNYRNVMVLRYVEQLSIKETALALGWGERKVRNTTHRALIKLRKTLGGEE